MPGVGQQRREEQEEVGVQGKAGWWPFWEREGKASGTSWKGEGPGCVREEGRAVDKGVET